MSTYPFLQIEGVDSDLKYLKKSWQWLCRCTTLQKPVSGVGYTPRPNPQNLSGPPSGFYFGHFENEKKNGMGIEIPSFNAIATVLSAQQLQPPSTPPFLNKSGYYCWAHNLIYCLLLIVLLFVEVFILLLIVWCLCY